MIKVIQRGKKANTVLNFFNALIVKRYLSLEASWRERQGIKEWLEFVDNKKLLPKSYFFFKNIGIFEYVGGKNIEKARDKKRIISDLVSIYINFLEKYSYWLRADNSFLRNWERYLERIYKIYCLYLKKIIKENFPSSVLFEIEETLREVSEMEWCVFPKIPLHRDLHWGNLLVSKNQVEIMDFEHFLVGPLEYEFCNSLFWNDRWSLDFKMIRKEFEKKGVYLNFYLAVKLTVVYFIEQLDIAFKNKDTNKVKLLFLKFFNFRKKYCFYFEKEKPFTACLMV